MQKKLEIKITNIEEFKSKLLLAGKKYKRFVLLDSNNYTQEKTSNYTYYEFDFLAGIGSVKEINTESFESLSDFNKQNNDWLFGYLTYDLKNELENLKSNNPDNLFFPKLHFFIPEMTINIQKMKLINIFHQY